MILLGQHVLFRFTISVFLFFPNQYIEHFSLGTMYSSHLSGAKRPTCWVPRFYLCETFQGVEAPVNHRVRSSPSGRWSPGITDHTDFN